MVTSYFLVNLIRKSQMKVKKELKETSSSSVYKKLHPRVNNNLRCTRCGVNKGCNKRARRRKNYNRNWKNYRKTQYGRKERIS